MRYVVILIAVILLFPIIFKEPVVSGQKKDPVIVPTSEQKEARALGVENDKRSLAINKDIASVTELTVPNSKLRAEVLRYKRKAVALQRENNYYKRKIFTLKKVLKVNYGKEPDYDKSILEYSRIDTVYLPAPRKRKGVFKIFN